MTNEERIREALGISPGQYIVAETIAPRPALLCTGELYYHATYDTFVVSDGCVWLDVETHSPWAHTPTHIVTSWYPRAEDARTGSSPKGGRVESRSSVLHGRATGKSTLFSWSEVKPWPGE